MILILRFKKGTPLHWWSRTYRKTIKSSSGWVIDEISAEQLRQGGWVEVNR